MLNIVSSTVADPAGYVELDVRDDSTAGETRRRVSRIATLDGGVVVNDGGHSAGDRIIELTWASRSQAADDGIDRLVQTYTRVIVVTRAGVFLAAPEAFTPGAEESKLRLLVISKLSS